MTSIPLICIICPKKPTFSDISHLLTHVGSKGHLSSYFKAQVRSRQEPAIREQVLAYDRWYAENQLEKLLSERMISKASKPTGPRKRVGNDGPFQFTKPTKRASLNRRRSQIKEESLIDPQLSQSPFIFRSPSPTVLHSLCEDYDSVQRAPIAKMNQRETLTSDRQEARQVPSQGFSLRPVMQIVPQKSDDYNDGTRLSSPIGTAYPDPSSMKNQPTYHGHQSQSFRGDMMHLDTIHKERSEDGNEPASEEEGESECTRLKGIQWPGMAIFDSASPEARRMRNQKKDGSILEQMIANSMTVQPVELIFNVDGGLKKRRQISGQVESSPTMEETPKPTRHRSKPKRTALVPISTNVPRASTALRSTTPTIRTRKARAGGLERHLRQALREKRPTSSIATRAKDSFSNTFDDDEAEFNLTMGDLANKRTRGFRIYSEKSNNQHQRPLPLRSSNSVRGDYPFLQLEKVSREELAHTHELQLLSSSFQAPDFDTRNPYATLREREDGYDPHSIYLPRSHLGRTDNKENLEPIMDHAGKIDGSGTHTSIQRSTQRYFTARGAESPFLFHALPPPMDFGPFHNPDAFGQSFNPLTFALQQPISQQSSHFQKSYIQANTHNISPRHKMTAPGGPEVEMEIGSENDTIDEHSGDPLMLFLNDNI
ncbi:hypothetical protein MMC06_001984 [Schaereria dolodes]|nr:hypothetical protein [Schaereria dolodes]